MKYTVLTAQYREEDEVDVYICATREVADKHAMQLIADYVDEIHWCHYNQEHVKHFRSLVEAERYVDARHFWNDQMSHFKLDVTTEDVMTETEGKVVFRWP